MALARSLTTTLSTLCLGLALAGCGGDSTSTGTPGPGGTPAPVMASHLVVPSLGQVFSADVRVLAPGGGGLAVAELARGKTRPDGTVELDIPADAEGPFIVEVSGNDEAEYYDEGLDQRVPLRAGDQIRAVLATLPAGGIGVTPLTELAVRYLEAYHGPLLALSGEQLAQLLASGAIEEANARIRDELAPELEDILAVPALVGSSTDLAALGASARDLYALKLAALAKLASQNHDAAQPALAIMRELAEDLADGALDGRRFDVDLATLNYDIHTLAAQLGTAAQQLAAGAPPLADLLASLQQYISPFVAALAALPQEDDDIVLPPLPVPGDLLASWAGQYEGALNVSLLKAEAFVPFLGWQRDPVTELALKAAMELLSLVNGGGCHLVIDPSKLSLGNVEAPFAASFAAAAVGDARTYTLPASLSVLGFQMSATTTVKTQGLLPTQASLSYLHSTPVTRLSYNASCSFSYVL